MYIIVIYTCIILYIHVYTPRGHTQEAGSIPLQERTRESHSCLYAGTEGSDTGGNHVHLHRNQLEIRVRNQKSNSSARNQKSTRIGRGASESRSKFRIPSYSHSTGVCRACAGPAVDVMTSDQVEPVFPLVAPPTNYHAHARTQKNTAIHGSEIFTARRVNSAICITSQA